MRNVSHEEQMIETSGNCLALTYFMKMHKLKSPLSNCNPPPPLWPGLAVMPLKMLCANI